MSWAILRNTFGSQCAERLDKLLRRIFWNVSKSMRLQARAPSVALSRSSGERIAADDASSVYMLRIFGMRSAIADSIDSKWQETSIDWSASCLTDDDF